MPSAALAPPYPPTPGSASPMGRDEDGTGAPAGEPGDEATGRSRGQHHEPLATTRLERVARALTLSSTPAGTTMGRNDREWGQMGVIMMAGTLGWIMEAPAATAYAVLPVGVETITPEEQLQAHSPCAHSRRAPRRP